MITRLLDIQFMRLKRQKILYLFFLIMAGIIVFNAFSCRGSSEDNGMGYYAGGRFPMMCMQSYIDLIGTLFISFISAVLICGEKANGMLKQLLLGGVSKRQLLMAKTVSILLIVWLCFLFVILFSMGTGFLFWGNHVFDNSQEYLLQTVLLVFPQTTMVLFLVLLSLYMSNISTMMCASLIILLLNNLFSQFFGKYIMFADFMYYLYAFSGYNGMALEKNMILSGITVNIVTGIILAFAINRRMENMTM